MPLRKPCLLADTGRLKFTRRFVWCLFLLAAPISLFAQGFTPNPDWRFENFNSQNHFISREISNLAMDKHGYVWTSSSGIQRFDGFKTVDFNSFDHARNSLKDNYTDVIADPAGRVWVSSAGLCYYDDLAGKFIYIQPDAPHPAITNAFCFCVQKNNLWFVCDYGLAKIDIQTFKMSFTALTDARDPLETCLIDPDHLLISTREKVYIYDIKNDAYTANTLIYNHSLLKILAVVKKGPTIFIGTNHGLFSYQDLRHVSMVCKETENILIDDLLFLPADKQQQYLFLGTDGKGLMVYNTITQKIVFTYLHDNDNLYSLSGNVINKFYADNNGRVWISTNVGLSMLDVNNQQLKMRFLNRNTANDININKVVKDAYDDSTVWMSSFNQGMIRINWKTKQTGKVYANDPDMHKVIDFVQLGKDRWLLATQDKIMEWTPMAGITYKTKLPVPDSLSLVYYIRRIISAGANTCFITTNKGLFKYELSSHSVDIVSENKGPKTRIELLKYDLLNGFLDKEVLWIASRNGLFTYDIGKNATVIYGGSDEKKDYFFTDVAKTNNNQVACAAANGLTIFNRQTKTFKVIHSLANLLNPNCVGVVCINSTLWVGTEGGMVKYDLLTNRSARAEHENPLTQIFPLSPFTVYGNEIILGLRNGYAYFTADLKNAPLPSNPLIENVYVNNRPALKENMKKYGGDKPAFNHADNSINIAFTAFLYTNPDQVRFRYRLKGADAGWQDAADQRSANYAQLSPGDYTFYVQCGNKDGLWNNHLASFSFVIDPPFWETWWFRTAVVLLIGLALYSLYRYRINNILAIQHIRERIASDFHDDIGSALSSISIFGDIADAQLEEKVPHEETREVVGHITTHARAMLEAMDDIVWAVNPRNDHFNDLAVRMREFAIPLLEAKNIRFDIDINESILNTRIKMEARKNIFLIFKECINNLLKHSACTAMKVQVTKTDTYLEIVISDNGRGFDLSAPTNRNGLKNLQMRAAEINGRLQVTTKPGAGVVTRLVIDI